MCFRAVALLVCAESRMAEALGWGIGVLSGVVEDVRFVVRL